MFIRKRIYEIIEGIHDRDRASQLFDYFLISVIFINLVAVIVNFNDEIAENYYVVLIVIKRVSIAIFLLEYSLRLWTAKYKYPQKKYPHLRYVFSFLGLLDLLVILSFFLTFFIVIDFRYLRIFRFFRIIIRMIRLYVALNREKQFVRQAFSTYLSSAVVTELIADPAKLCLGGEKKEMTVLFTDLRSFSSISENMDPTLLVLMLNKYFTTMSNIIMDNQGTIDKYIGDGIVAFFGAPIYREDHAALACFSALAMKQAEDELNSQLLAEGLISVPLFTRIGINTGEMVAGNMGSQTKMNYTVMGNAVNIAARLEGANKQYQTSIIISEFTKNKIGDVFLCRRFDRLRVVGIEKPVQIYELRGIADKAEPKELILQEKWNEAMTHFEKRDFERALVLFESLCPNDGTAALYMKRCISFLEKPPLPDWDGVFDFRSGQK